MSDETGREIAEHVYEARLTREEFDRRLTEVPASMAGPEGEAVREHIAWFVTRYPTALARLRYARRKFHEAEKGRGMAGPG